MKSRQRRSFSAEMKAHPLSDAANWYYVILAPPGATVGSPGECGYHSSSTLNVSGTSIDLAWGLVFFPTPTAGEPNVNVVNSVCYCLVHEMVEAFTNPRGAGWSVNVPASGGNVGQNCEIGDLCETKAFHNVGRWNVETYWSNQDQAALAPSVPTGLHWALRARVCWALLSLATTPMAAWNASLWGRTGVCGVRRRARPTEALGRGSGL